MSERATLEAVIRDVYDARMRGDVDGILRHVRDDVRFSIAGCAASSVVPCSVAGAPALREVMGQLVSAFEFRDGRVLGLLVDGSRAVVHWHMRVRSPVTGDEADTELVDLVEFAGDKILSFRQFADTALASRLVGGSRPVGPA